uniref:Uncharacterized protein n=1 Tax=Timema bartmani TaxID=61472 RepID=A0A7R9I332_9NEOP|nr:unnamed protein product [Timema bartmani]
MDSSSIVCPPSMSTSRALHYIVSTQQTKDTKAGILSFGNTVSNPVNNTAMCGIAAYLVQLILLYGMNSGSGSEWDTLYNRVKLGLVRTNEELLE